MRRPAHPTTRTWLGLAALALAAGCDDGGRSPAPVTDRPTPTPSAPPPTAPAAGAGGDTHVPAEATPPTVRHRPGPAYLGVDEVGLLRLEDGQLTTLVQHRYPFKQIVVDADGVIYAAAIGGVFRIDGTRVQRIDDGRGMPFESIALGPDGVLWASDHRAVHRYDGAWTHEPSDTFDKALIQDLDVDLDGRVWVLATNTLWRLDGDRWSKLDPSFAGAREPYFGSLAVSADGAVHLSAIYGTFMHRHGRWLDSGMNESIGRNIDELVAGPAGHVAGSGSVGLLAMAAPGAPLWRAELSDGVARAHRGDLLAVDAAGRMWITTDNGLVILDERGDLLQQWEPGTVAGVRGKITAVAVVDDGPTLPTLRPAATGAITGRVLRAGKPVAGAGVQICDMPLSLFEHTPCESSTFSKLTTTGSDGGFRLAGVPVGSYGFAVRPDTRWIILLDSNCCTELEDGRSFDIGAITVR